MKKSTKSKFARNHHTVPQLYLASFTSTGQVGGVLYAHDLEQLKSWPSSTAGVGFQKDFYRVDLLGIEPDVVEKGFNNFEGLAARVLRNIIKDKKIPAGKDYAILMNFIALQIIRVPRMRENIFESDVVLLQQILEMNASLPDEELIARLEPLKRKNPEFSDISIEDFRKFVESGEYTIMCSQNTHMRNFFVGLLPNVNKIASLLGRRNWSLLIAKERAGYIITSDHPVILDWSVDVPEYFAKRPGFGLKHTVVYIPISKTIVLEGRFDGELGVVDYLNESTVASLNSLVIGSATRFLYSPHENFTWETLEGKIGDVNALFNAIKESPETASAYPDGAS